MTVYVVVMGFVICAQCLEVDVCLCSSNLYYLKPSTANIQRSTPSDR